MNKAEFTHRWVVNLLGSIDAHVDEATRVRLMESCGRECARGEAVEAVKHCRGDLDRLQSTLRKWLGKDNVRREGNTVYLEYRKCFCRLGVELPRSLAETYCSCSCGWLKEVFATALGRPVELDLIASIKRGAQACRFEVHV